MNRQAGAGEVAGDSEGELAPGTRVFLSLGSNLGDRRAHLAAAVVDLGAMVRGVSPVYETAPVGGPVQERFLNLVVELRTALSPRELLGVCHRLESAAERVRTERWGPRTLDVDIIWIDGVTVDEPDLQIPHPRAWERRFVLAPLADLAPDLVDPDELGSSHGIVELAPPLDLVGADHPDQRDGPDRPGPPGGPDPGQRAADAGGGGSPAGRSAGPNGGDPSAP